MVLVGIGLWFVALFIGFMVILPIKILLSTSDRSEVFFVVIVWGCLWMGVFGFLSMRA